MNRTIITILMLAAAGLIAVALVLSSQKADTPKTTQPKTPKDVAAPQTPPQSPPDTPPAPTDATAAEPQPAAPAPPIAAPAAPAAPVEPIAGLHVVPAAEQQPEPTLGSAAPQSENPDFMFEARFTPWGAGIKHILASRYSTQVVIKPEDFDPYPLQRSLEADVATHEEPATRYKYPLAAYAVNVNGQQHYLYHHRWRVISEADSRTQAMFEITLADGDEKPVLRITRRWTIQANRYDVNLSHTFENLSDQPLRIGFSQYGQAEMVAETGYLGDRRHVTLGYLQPPRSEAGSKYVTTADFDFDRTKLFDDADRRTLWPAPGDDPNRDLVWIATTNRYFTAAMHPLLNEQAPAIRSLEPQFVSVRRLTWGMEPSVGGIIPLLSTPFWQLEPAGQTNAALQHQVDIYAGPKDPAILKKSPVYKTLGLDQVIVYNLGGMCAFCTFAWLADLLLAFMTMIDNVLGDWGMAIVLLVAIVRLILHPLTKGAQVNMMKMSKQMQTLQPEIERLKKKYGDNQQKLNQEMMSLYREKGFNPASMGLGCLPMFLQMPIWFALYAMLYFAIELRHSPAFWGVFQKISGGNWLFLADLSVQDNFIRLPEINLWFFTLTSINLLPILMAVVFYLQQKYMTPQTTTALSEQQLQQQKIMKFMIMLFPIFLYKAPSGLTLYILASTTVGIIESYRVRKHIKELEDRGDFDPGGSGGGKPKGPKPGGWFDRLAKAAEQRQKMIEQQRKDRGGGGRSKKRR